jgi:ABC-2 type transport system ATP-binding protein
MMDVVEKVSHRIVLIDEGRVVANGSFDELQQQQGNQSLEKIFANLTGKDTLSHSADDLIRALDN